MDLHDSNILSYKDWRFIEEHLPHYYSRDDVLLSDILYRYVVDEGTAKEDIKMLEEDFHANKQEVFTTLIEFENKLMAEALENFRLDEQNALKKLDPIT